jgi:hypothetical protein
VGSGTHAAEFLPPGPSVHAIPAADVGEYLREPAGYTRDRKEREEKEERERAREGEEEYEWVWEVEEEEEEEEGIEE